MIDETAIYETNERAELALRLAEQNAEKHDLNNLWYIAWFYVSSALADMSKLTHIASDKRSVLQHLSASSWHTYKHYKCGHLAPEKFEKRESRRIVHRFYGKPRHYLYTKLVELIMRNYWAGHEDMAPICDPEALFDIALIAALLANGIEQEDTNS